MFNWWTLAFEVLNFLIILWVLMVLLYKPLRKAIRDRQARLDAEHEAARKERTEAEAAHKEYERKAEELAAQRKDLLAVAKERARTEAQAILDQARQQAQALRAAAARAIERQVQQARDDLRGQLAEAALNMVQQVIGSERGSADHSAALEEVDRLLGEVSEEERHRAGRALREERQPVAVRAAPALDQNAAQRLTRILETRLGVDGVALDAQEDPDLIRGLEVRLKNLLIRAHWRARLERLADEVRS
jgi:F-type H+-transporting ATPase subunit b